MVPKGVIAVGMLYERTRTKESNVVKICEIPSMIW